ncbi:lysozyme inhibitor LprI family protein [Brevundimonas staleyi]|uniref:Lysozyme inhibitor LprI family protein n=1 Tax=Brevundimonas staleyi TaxID=74326 RepID=A0ABW0FV93_9CAUL
MTQTLKLVVIAAGAGLLASAATAQTQSQLNATAAREQQAADRALNSQYTATMNQLSPSSRTLLRNAQRAWITFRDQQCRYESSAVQGGSAQPMVLSGCIARLSNERTRELRRLGQCEEGDLACPR